MTTKRRREFWLLTGDEYAEDVISEILYTQEGADEAMAKFPEEVIHVREVLPGDQDLQAEIERLREALEFYADKRFFRPNDGIDYQEEIDGKLKWKIDTGECARAALKGEKG